jgi:hypothetical protein
MKHGMQLIERGLGELATSTDRNDVAFCNALASLMNYWAGNESEDVLYRLRQSENRHAMITTLPSSAILN